MKVLFLDIDGVLNSERSRMGLKGLPHTFDEADMGKFDHVAVGLIRKVCELTDAVIVLSSSWRYYFKHEVAATALDLPIISQTPETTSTTRGEEIYAWLKEHPTVKTYAIVDDHNDMLEEQQPRLVLTNETDGLTYAGFMKLRNILQSDFLEE